MRWLLITEYRGSNSGGGYTAIAEGLSIAMHHLGEDLKVFGINYDGTPHPLPVSVIPSFSIPTLLIQLGGIVHGWKPDYVIVALDLPHHVDFLRGLGGLSGFKYIGIFPVEGAPLLPAWAEAISKMDYAFTISKFGVETCAHAGVCVSYFPITCTPGILTAKPDDREKMRHHVLLDGRRAILKNADNHSRKNWPHTLEFFTRWRQPGDVLYAVTRPENGYGWDLGDLCERFGATKIPKANVWEWDDGAQFRMLGGLSKVDLAWLYNICDAMMVDTGNEGACLPIYESFATKLPVVAIKHTAITEVVEGHGVLFEPGYKYIDPFGNVERWYPAYDTWAEGLDRLFAMPPDEREAMTQRAQVWVHNRTWIQSAEVMRSILNGDWLSAQGVYG